MSKKKKDSSLSQEDYGELITKLVEFEESAFINFAGTDMYEIIPTSTSEGKVLTAKEKKFLIRECERLGLTILWKVELDNGDIVLINQNNGRLMNLKEGMQ